MADARGPADGRLVAVDASAGRYELVGVAGFRTARHLLAAGEPLSAQSVPVEVDLKGVTAADSAGLALLLCWLERAKLANRKLRYLNLPQQLRALARLSDVESLLDAGA